MFLWWGPELVQLYNDAYARVMKWLARRGLLREADASNEAPSYSAGEAMTLAGMQRGTLETAKDTGERAEHELAEAPPPRHRRRRARALQPARQRPCPRPR